MTQKEPQDWEKLIIEFAEKIVIEYANLSGRDDLRPYVRQAAIKIIPLLLSSQRQQFLEIAEEAVNESGCVSRITKCSCISHDDLDSWREEAIEALKEKMKL